MKSLTSSSKNLSRQSLRNPETFYFSSYKYLVSYISFHFFCNLQYRAFDEDSGSNAKLYYELIQQVQEGMQLFAVDHSTGIVTTAQEIK